MGRSTLMESQQQATAAEIVDDVITEIKARNQLGAFNTESIGYQLFFKGVQEQLKADGVATISKRKDGEKAPERPAKKEKRDHPTSTPRAFCVHFCSSKGCHLRRCSFEHPEAVAKGLSDEEYRDDKRWKEVLEKFRSNKFKALVPVEWFRLLLSMAFHGFPHLLQEGSTLGLLKYFVDSIRLNNDLYACCLLEAPWRQELGLK